MGVPEFFRWLVERYPLAYEAGPRLTPPATDFLYVDLRGIVLACGREARRTDPEEEVLRKVYDHLNRLVVLVRPRAAVYLALDGVAPVAKIGQLRSQHFKAAWARQQEAKVGERRADGVELWDSNAVTPGTEFMYRLSKRLKQFIQKRIVEDEVWQTPKIFYNGPECPGEGKHKIATFIRNWKNSRDYQPNKRHCLYGLDADVVMLALVTHEPHFYLFRELVSFMPSRKGPGKREVLESPDNQKFVICRIGLLRDYLELDIRRALPKSIDVDVERIVDDFVLLCILAGNEFLPALPTLDILDGPTGKLLEAYTQILPELEGSYITQSGSLNVPRLLKVLAKVGETEGERLQRRAQDAAYFEEKLHRSGQLSIVTDCGPLDPPNVVPNIFGKEARLKDETGNQAEWIKRWKEHYYCEQLGVRMGDFHGLRGVGQAYIQGLCWTLEYYYKGVPSWSWYYPYHYAPLASDMAGLDAIPVQYEFGSPLKTFEHLLAVLPKASSQLLPAPLRKFMTSSSSPIADFCPDEVIADLDGTKSDSEGIMLIPFIDEERLRACVKKILPNRFSKSELKRNELGHCLVFTYENGRINAFLSAGDAGPVQGHLADPTPRQKCDQSGGRQPHNTPPGAVAVKGFRGQLEPGTNVGKMSPPGYPSLKTIDVEPSLQKLGVRIFNYSSDKETLLLTIKEKSVQTTDVARVAESLIGKIVYIDWPYLHKARVVQVESKEEWYTKEGSAVKTKGERQAYGSHVVDTRHSLMVKRGVDVVDETILLTVRRVVGWLKQRDGTVAERLGDKELWLLQAVLDNHPTQGACEEDKQPIAVDTMHSAGDKLLYVGRQYPGCVATVREDFDGRERGREQECNCQTVGVSVQPLSPASNLAWKSVQKYVLEAKETYTPSSFVAQRLAISPLSLARIAGSLWVNTGLKREEVGLAVKLGSKNMCIPGLVHPNMAGNGWEYADQLVEILELYKKTHAWVFKAVEATPEGGEINLPSLLPSHSQTDIDELVAETRTWLSQLSISDRPLVPAEVEVVPMAAIDKAVKILSLTAKIPRPVAMDANACDLIPASAADILSEHVGGDFAIGDLVVYVGTESLQFGVHGIVIGILPEGLEVLFQYEMVGRRSIFGKETKNQSCLVRKQELVNKSRLLQGLPGVEAQEEDLIGRVQDLGFSGVSVEEEALSSTQSGSSSARSRQVHSASPKGYGTFWPGQEAHEMQRRSASTSPLTSDQRPSVQPHQYVMAPGTRPQQPAPLPNYPYGPPLGSYRSAQLQGYPGVPDAAWHGQQMQPKPGGHAYMDAGVPQYPGPGFPPQYMAWGPNGEGMYQYPQWVVQPPQNPPYSGWHQQFYSQM